MDSDYPKYNSTELNPTQKDALKAKIETFLGDAKTAKELTTDPTVAKAYTLFEFQLNPTGPMVAVDFVVTKFTGTADSGTANVKVTSVAEPEKSAAVPQIDVLSGAEGFIDSRTHVGIAIELSSSGKTSVLTIPDVGAVKSGASPVYITKPIKLELDKLKTFLEKKNVKLPDEVGRLLSDSQLSCDAFYFTANGPLLMFFQLKFTKGLIASLTGDPAIGELFDVNGAAVRVLRCPTQEALTALQNYAAELREQRAIRASS
jgi:hypothetical protein